MELARSKALSGSQFWLSAEQRDRTNIHRTQNSLARSEYHACPAKAKLGFKSSRRSLTI
jgi:hypothetical protein